MAEEPQTVVAAYFDAWRDGDIAALRPLLADDVTFAGPLGRAANADEAAHGIERMSEMTTDIVIQKMVADGPDVLTWFDLHTKVAEPTPVANWSRVEDGRLKRIRATFDPRPLLPPDGQ